MQKVGHIREGESQPSMITENWGEQEGGGPQQVERAEA